MAQNMSNFVTNLGGKVGNVVNQFNIVWQKIKERDNNYKDVMTTTEFDEVENSAVNFDEGDIEYDDGGVGELVEFDNVMRSYLEAIQAQLQNETNTKKNDGDVNRWLLDYLKKNDFWLHK